MFESYRDSLYSYARYYEDMHHFSYFPLYKHLTVRELKLSRGTIQRAYKDIKNFNFDSNIIDYLCFIGMLYIGVKTYLFWYNRNEPIVFEDIEKDTDLFLKFSNSVDQTALAGALRLFIKDEKYVKIVSLMAEYPNSLDFKEHEKLATNEFLKSSRTYRVMKKFLTESINEGHRTWGFLRFSSDKEM